MPFTGLNTYLEMTRQREMVTRCRDTQGEREVDLLALRTEMLKIEYGFRSL